MSKIFKTVIAIILIITMLIIQTSNTFALAGGDFFKTNKLEISQGETLEMTLDISKVLNEKFEFKLSTNLDATSIVVNENINAEKYNNDISINIEKEKISINKISFFYQVPEESQVGTTIKLNAQIIIEEESEDDNGENIKSEKVIENKIIEVKIVEKQQNEQNDAKADMPSPSNPIPSPSNVSGENLGNIEKSQKQMVSYSSIPSTSFSSSTLPTNTETAVYNGSGNNYLAALEIEGENLNTTFNKENQTYFIETKGKTELNINATAEESSAKVYITGNNTLKNGDNKILISVTAENGSVRYYRVFVTNN